MFFIITGPSVSTSTSTASICQGDSILLGGAFQNSAGVYNDTIIGGGANGCDSIIITTLTVNSLSTSTSTASICQGDSILLGGVFQNSAGVYNDTIIGGGANGCDSIIITTLTVNSLPTSTGIASICQGDSILLGGAFQNSAGVYNDTIIGGGLNGCDSIIETTLTVNPAYLTTASANICTGDSIFLQGSWQTTSAIYYDTLTSVGACDSMIATTLTINLLPDIDAGNDVSINSGDSIILNATGTNGTYTWSPPDWLSCVVCPSTISTPDETITYYVTISDSNGCEARDSITITVVDIICGDVFVPNIFSPNGDEQNDVLYVYGSCIETIDFFIYDRWGELVYEAHSASQAMDTGWNGKFKGKGKLMNSATFVYALTVTFKNGDEHSEKGNIALVR